MSKETKSLMFITIIFVAACIETDIYLPAFADMMTFFSVSEGQIQSLLTWNFVGICLSGSFYGPVSDSIGRKTPLLIALGMFFLGSVITVFTNDFNMMLLGRILQGIGSGGCFTLGSAIIFDCFKPERAVQALAHLNTIIPFIMAGAPLLGGYLNQFYGFRSNFFVIALTVFISLIICLFFFEEPLKKEKRIPFSIGDIFNNMKTVLLSIPFWQVTIVLSLAFAGYLAFLSTISVLFVLEFGVSKQQLPAFQLAVLVAWIAGCMTLKYGLRSLGELKVKIAGTLLSALGAVFLLLVSLLMPMNPYALTGAVLLYMFGIAWINGVYFPEGMAIFPEIKGVTASLITSIRLFITAGIIAIISEFYDSTSFPIVGGIICITSVVLLTIFFYEKKKINSPASQSKDYTDSLSGH